MYEVVLSRQARRYYAQAPVFMAQRLARVFVELERDARPAGSKPLHGALEGMWRIRVGGLRIIYEIRASAHEIRIVKIGARGDVY